MGGDVAPAIARTHEQVSRGKASPLVFPGRAGVPPAAAGVSPGADETAIDAADGTGAAQMQPT